MQRHAKNGRRNSSHFMPLRSGFWTSAGSWRTAPARSTGPRSPRLQNWKAMPTGWRVAGKWANAGASWVKIRIRGNGP